MWPNSTSAICASCNEGASLYCTFQLLRLFDEKRFPFVYRSSGTEERLAWLATRRSADAHIDRPGPRVAPDARRIIMGPA